jgi:hypothetical protein
MVPTGDRRPRVDIRTTRGLGLALPIRRGDRVLVAGDGSLRPLAVSLENTGAEVVVHGEDLAATIVDGLVAAGREPVEPPRWTPPADRLAPSSQASFDHLLTVVDADTSPRAALEPFVADVRPGGFAGVGFPASASRLRGHVRTVQRVRRELAAIGLEVDTVLGVRQSLSDVRHLVPLQGPALRWYARDVRLAGARRGARAARGGAALAPSTWLHRIFPGLFAVARRTGGAV